MRIVLIILFCFLPFPVFAFESSLSPQPEHIRYQMKVVYDEKTHQIHGTMQVTFTQKAGVTWNELYFNLWPNADVYRQHGGGITVHRADVNGKNVRFTVHDTTLRLSGFSLPHGRAATVRLDFTLHIPNIEDRLGWSGTTTSLGNWFPTLAVYDDEGWNVDPYFQHGESFYSLSSDFDVSVMAEASQVVVATGRKVQKLRLGKYTLHQFQAKNVRDFAMQIDPTYQVKTGKVGKVKVNVYYTPQQTSFSDVMLRAALKSLRVFNQKYGNYPWPELDVVGMKGWFGGMEYPQLVMISISERSTPKRVERVVAHEVAHQWFYGVIGNNQFDEPWLDESFASFSEAVYFNDYRDLNTEPLEDARYHLSSPVSVFMSRGEEGKRAYVHMIYDYGARTLNDLRILLGEQQFFHSMKIYFQKKKFGVSTTKEFI